MQVEFGISWVARVPLVALRRSAIGYDHERLAGAPGVALVGQQRRRPAEALRTPAEHLREMIARGWIGDGSVLVQTMRNLVQNPRCPAYRKGTGVCAALGEDVERAGRCYRGIAHRTDGMLAGVALDLTRPVPDDIRFWGAGIPVLWDGEVATLERLLPEVGDVRHLFRVEDPERVRRLAGVFEATRFLPAADAARALAAETTDLPRENDYLHNAVGVGSDYLVLVAANGPLEHIGRLASAAGASHACVIDNGGSSQIALRRRGGEMRPLLESYYFREPTIALAAYELDGEASSGLFFGGRFGLAATSPARDEPRRYQCRSKGV